VIQRDFNAIGICAPQEVCIGILLQFACHCAVAALRRQHIQPQVLQVVEAALRKLCFTTPGRSEQQAR